jgi:hypothetical protein
MKGRSDLSGCHRDDMFEQFIRRETAGFRLA